MVIKQSRVYLTLLALILTACQAGGTKTTTAGQPPPQTPTHIFIQIPESQDTPFITTKAPTTIPSGSPSTLSAYPIEIHITMSSGLTIDEYALISAPQVDPLTYTAIQWSAGEMHIKHNPYRWDTFPDIYFFNDMLYSMSTTYEGQNMVATEYFTGTSTGESFGAVYVYKAGELIDKIPIGNGSPIEGLRGLWTYDQNWVVETAYVISSYNPEKNEDTTTATGQVAINGVMLNDRDHFDETFGFQTMHGRPFYFYRQEGKINISYDDQSVGLGYDTIPHYGCCSAAELNPRQAKNMISFFAQKNGTWYYVEVGVFN